MVFYFGTPGWGWHLWGFGYKTKWFFGFSRKQKPSEPALSAFALDMN